MSHSTYRRTTAIRLKDNKFIPLIESSCSNDDAGWQFHSPSFWINGKYNLLFSREEIEKCGHLDTLPYKGDKFGWNNCIMLPGKGYNFSSDNLKKFISSCISNSTTFQNLTINGASITISWWEKIPEKEMTTQAWKHFDYTHTEEDLLECINFHPGCNICMTNLSSEFYKTIRNKFR